MSEGACELRVCECAINDVGRGGDLAIWKLSRVGAFGGVMIRRGFGIERRREGKKGQNWVSWVSWVSWASRVKLG